MSTWTQADASSGRPRACADSAGRTRQVRRDKPGCARLRRKRAPMPGVSSPIATFSSGRLPREQRVGLEQIAGLAIEPGSGAPKMSMAGPMRAL